MLISRKTNEKMQSMHINSNCIEWKFCVKISSGIDYDWPASATAVTTAAAAAVVVFI